MIPIGNYLHSAIAMLQGMYILRFLGYYLLDSPILYIVITVNQQIIKIPVIAYPCLLWALEAFQF